MQFIVKVAIVILLGVAGYAIFTQYFSKNELTANLLEDAQSVETTPQPAIEEPQQSKPAKMYKWTDANGKVHFGDTPPQDAISNVQDVSDRNVQTTKFSETPKIKPIYIPPPNRSSSHSSSGSSKKERCKKLKAQVDRDMRSDARLTTRSHHAKRQREKDNRWEMIKNCN